ncbi:serine/threonine protein kinase SRPK1 [Trifolium pratense]|uniref:Serine/threonine protein kinase SRPK1 n=1 Tax=Trifolium pratense TaxID=57577 RepID=A0A2K3LKC3_TRIPR|nr:serine/threonine protein kinase SRPK1 [Trifolium pratense]
MSGEDGNQTPRVSTSEGSGGKAAFGHDYLSNESYEHSGSRKSLVFNFDATLFEWWKERLYSNITAIDHELWDLVQLGVTFEHLNEHGRLSIEHRKLLTPANLKIYTKHHKVKDIVVGAIGHEDYVRIENKSSAKSIFDSMCVTYDGNEKVQEAKASLLIRQYELFTMEKDEDIETMFTRFQTLVSGLKVLKRSYTTYDHVQKILRSLPLMWRPKVTAIEEAQNLKNMSLESTKTSSKALKTQLLDIEEESPADGQEDEMGEEEFALFTKFQQWARFNKKNFRGNNSRNSGKKEEQKNCFNCKKPGHFIADCPEISSMDKSKRYSSKKQQFKSKLKKSLMATFEELSSEEEVEEDEEANLALMASTDSDVDSDDEPESDSEAVDEESHFRGLYQQTLDRVTDLEKGCVVFYKPSDEQEMALQQFVHLNVGKSKAANLVYNVLRNRGEGFDYEYGRTYSKLKTFSKRVGKSLVYYVVPQSEEGKNLDASRHETLDLSSPEADDSEEPSSSDSKKRSSEDRSCSDSETFKSDDLNTSKSGVSTSVVKDTSVPEVNQPKTLKAFKRKEPSLKPQKQNKTQIIYDLRVRRYN